MGNSGDYYNARRAMRDVMGVGVVRDAGRENAMRNKYYVR